MPVEHTNPTASPGSWSLSSTGTRGLRSKELNSGFESALVWVSCPEVVGQRKLLPYLTEQMVLRKGLNFGGQRAVASALWFCTLGAWAHCHPPEQPLQRLFPWEHCCEGWQCSVCACTREDNLNPSPWGLSPQPSTSNSDFSADLVCLPLVRDRVIHQYWDSHTGTEQGSALARTASPPPRKGQTWKTWSEWQQIPMDFGVPLPHSHFTLSEMLFR